MSGMKMRSKINDKFTRGIRMKKIRKLLLLAAVTAMLIPGCGKTETEPEPAEPVVTEPVESAAPEEALQEIITDQLEPGEELPDGKKYSSLTGEIISKKSIQAKTYGDHAADR